MCRSQGVVIETVNLTVNRGQSWALKSTDLPGRSIPSLDSLFGSPHSRILVDR
jgi:hypothetical protein